VAPGSFHGSGILSVAMAAEEIKIEVERSPNRCPYCHDEVLSSEDDWLACADCLARHHDECWRELGRCSSCAGERSLALGAPSAVGSVTTVKPKRRKARFTRATREKIHNAIWWLGVLGGVPAVCYLWPDVGCWAIFLVWMASSAIDSVLKELLGLGRKRPRRKKKSKDPKAEA